jgi:D-3-phosphoglycerate dehydrogenase
MADRVLITDGVFGGFHIERSLLEPLGAEVVEAPAQDEATLVREAASAAAMLVCFAPVGRPVVEAAAGGGCRVIARYGIGVDNVDVAAATEHGIVVTNVPDYCLDEVADHALALLLAHARLVSEAAGTVREGGWSIEHGAVHRLAGRRLALVGLGAIGRRVAGRARAFGLEVVAYDPFLDPWDVDGVERAPSLADAVRDADFVSLHAPMTDETRHLVDSDLLAAMRSRPLLINTARGGLVDLEAALDALDRDALAGIAFDVTEPEPLAEDHPLRRHPRAIITPHMAFHSVEATEELQRRAAEEVVRALRGEPPRCPVNAVAAAGRET